MAAKSDRFREKMCHYLVLQGESQRELAKRINTGYPHVNRISSAIAQDFRTVPRAQTKLRLRKPMLRPQKWYHNWCQVVPKVVPFSSRRTSAGLHRSAPTSRKPTVAMRQILRRASRCQRVICAAMCSNLHRAVQVRSRTIRKYTPEDSNL